MSRLVRILAPWPSPVIEDELVADFLQIRNAALAELDSLLGPFRRRGDALPSALNRRLSAMAERMTDKVPTSDLRGAVIRSGRETNARNKAAIERQLSQALDVEVALDVQPSAEEVSAWVEQTTSEITSVREQAIPGLRKLIEHAWEKGWTAEQLEQRIVERGVPLEWGTLEGRAKSIARDQLGTLHGLATEKRLRELGGTHYFWRTMEDQDVRPSHERRNRRRFSWRRPPRDGHPGHPHGCRCSAEASCDLELATKNPKVRRR